MTSNQVTEDLLAQSQGLRTSSDVDSDLSEEEEFSPEPEQLIQGPSTGFSGRGPQNADSAGPKDKTKKDKSNVPLPQPRKTDKPPPENKPKPANYSQASKSR